MTSVLRSSNFECLVGEEPLAVTAFETELGWMALTFGDSALTQVAFGYPSLAKLLEAYDTPRQLLASDVPQWVSELRDRLQRFAQGEPQEFVDVPLDQSHLTPFACRVVRECRRLGWGQTATYAQLAKRAGRPGAARAVGNVMASNRFPLVVPCHRVTGSSGGLGGYSAPGGLATKRRLLAVEGSL